MWQSSVPLSKTVPLSMHTVVCPIRVVVTRVFRKSGSSTRAGGRPFLIIAWRVETIPDNHLAPTFYKISLGPCSHQNSLSVADETWALSIGIPDVSTSTGASAQPPTDIRLRFADVFASASKVCLSLTMCPGFQPALPRNVFYEDHSMLVVILCTSRQSFPTFCLNKHSG